MMSLEYSFDRTSLLPLAIKDPTKRASFWKSDLPLFWLAANDYAKHPRTFYKNAAKILDLEYIEEIPVKINDSESLASKIGATSLSKWQFFPTLDHNRLYIYCADPFAHKQILNVCQSYIHANTHIEIKLASLATIRRTIQSSVYQTSINDAESELLNEHPELSSKGILSSKFKTSIAISVASFIAVFLWQPPAGFIIFFAIVNIMYFILNPFKLVIGIGGLKFKPHVITGRELRSTPKGILPIYTILVPAKDEASIIPKLLRHLKKIDYPAEKLDIKLITEVNDKETIKAFEKDGNDGRDTANFSNSIFEIIKVPTGAISTKPRSCNYALQFARGRLTVIYDAEDRPDPMQLRKAYSAFLDEKLNTLCIQAKLNFYNAKQNWLTRFFSIEYGFWYDFMLPGLQAWNIPLPLGGTSNHFLTETLREIGTWDPYNVTEDADLGWRLSRLGYRTTMLESYTLEEANSQLWNWVRQRTRWQKGFLITNMVHLRHPVKLWQELGVYGFISSVSVFSTNFLLPLLNPILWAFFLAWYTPPLIGLSPIGFPVPDWVYFIGMVNLILGNGIFILIHVIAAIAKKRWLILPLIPLLPIYWLLISFASYRSIYQVLINKPYSWEKTRHGLTH